MTTASLYLPGGIRNLYVPLASECAKRVCGESSTGSMATRASDTGPWLSLTVPEISQ